MRGTAERGRLSGRRGLALCCLFVLVAAAALTGVYAVGRKLEAPDALEETRGSLEGRFPKEPEVLYNGEAYRRRQKLTNVLLMGVDGASDAGQGFRNGGQADFLMLLVVDHQARTITPIQIDRDTMAEVTVLGVLGNVAGTRRAQICLSHGFGDGGAQSCLFTADAVSKLLLGVEIDYYIAVNMGGISVLNDTLGGVTVTLEEDLTALDPDMARGATLTLAGAQAELFVRSRQGVGGGTNQERMARQRTYLLAAMERLDEKLPENSGSVMGELFDALGSDLHTDMKRGRMINEAWNTREYTRAPIRTLEGEHVVGEDGFMEFHASQTALERMVVELFYEPVEIPKTPEGDEIDHTAAHAIEEGSI